jgi:hypothetical protein
VVLDRLLLLGYVEERHDLGTDLFDTVMRELRIEGLFTPPVEGAVRHDGR